MILRAGYVQTPVGRMIAVVNERDSVTRLEFADKDEEVDDYVWDPPAVKEVHTQLAEYFAGKRQEFDLPLDPQGSDFQKKVWAELVRIPFGQTVSYGALAQRVGRPGAARAVGRANATNPIAIVVPCHRVIGSDRTLTGYGGGLSRKEALLKLEGASGQARLF